jgi:hypothetical protein
MLDKLFTECSRRGQVFARRPILPLISLNRWSIIDGYADADLISTGWSVTSGHADPSSVVNSPAL